MRILTIFLLLFLCFTGKAQDLDTLNKSNAQGDKTGYWIVRHPNGNIRYEGRFEQGKPMGMIRRYDEKGILQSVLHYVPESDTVTVEMYYPNGYIAAKGSYLHREKEGKWQFFSYFTKEYKVLEEHYKNGLRDGKSCKYHPNGNTAEVLYWKSGQKQGRWEQFALTGELLLKANYEQGKLHGNYLVNYENEQAHVKGSYLQDFRNGEWIFMDENGKVTLRIHFTRGIADNQATLDSLHQEFLNELDSNKGKIKDPTIDEIKW